MITFVLGAAQENLKLLGTAALSGTGNDVANIITGNAGANTLDGKGGVDDLNGAAGNDTYIVDSSSDKVTEADKGGTDLVKSSQSFTLGDFVENLTLLPGSGDIDGKGNGLNNVITGNEGDNELSGLAGNDTLAGGAGNDTLDGGTGNDMMTGGDGDDVYGVDSVTDKVTESSTTGGRDKVESAITYTLGANLEDLTLTGAIDGTGNALGNVLIGGAGANKLDGKAGADTMEGGLGDDIYVVDNLKDVVDETSGGGNDTIQIATAFDLAAPSITIIGAIENVTLTGTAVVGLAGDGAANYLRGNSSANTLTGLGGDDTLDGGAGADTMSGGAGNDTYVVDNAKDVVQELGKDSGDAITASIAIDLAAYAGIEDVTLTGTSALKVTGDEQDNLLRGNAGGNLLTGNGGADTLVGGAGNDTLDGRAGTDNLAGGLGNDTYLIADVGNTVSEAFGEGTDTVKSSLASFTLDANVDNLVLLAGAVSGTGNGLSNLITGNDAANNLDGGVGVDTLVGGKGDDSYSVDDAKDVITEGAGAGTDTVTSTAVSYTLGVNVENLVLGVSAVSGTGNTLNNTLIGNGGDNTLDGKTGVDHMIGGVGNDTYIVDNIGDIVDESGIDAGSDTVSSSIAFSLVANGATVLGSIEDLTLTGAGAISGTGNTLANKIIGNAGANALFGNGGDDTLDGGGGNDLLTGGTGNDHINLITGNDTVRYTSTVDGHDVIDNFDGNATGGQDVLNLDALFDSLSIATADRAGRVGLTPGSGTVDVSVDVSALHDAGNVITVATLNLANPADVITVGQDVVVGTL
jgi:trimeric autotransporter adhesin